jgi:hypothetical protein
MNGYVKVEELAEKWNVSIRQAQLLCQSGMSQIFKRFIVVLTAVFLFTSCAGNSQPATAYSPGQVAAAILSALADIQPLRPLLPSDSYFADYLSEIYRIDDTAIEDGAIYYSLGVRADEIAVLLLADDSDADSVKDALISYKENRKPAFEGYAPKQAAILENGVVVTRGNYIALLICEETQEAEKVFAACFGENPPPIPDESPSSPPSGDEESAGTDAEAPQSVKPSMAAESPTDRDGTELPPSEVYGSPSSGGEAPPKPGAETPEAEPVEQSIAEEPTDNQEDAFDSGAVMEAWRSGDKTKLSSKNRSILDAAADMLNTLVSDEMSDYEKELAIHDWIVDWARYDTDVNSNSPDAQPDPDNDNPYGLIFNRKAICSGYTSTFQLFMNLAGIECVSVHGTYANTGSEHAWNMVRLDGEWYCVDVTWNDPSDGDPDGSERYRYFNVTSQFMRETGHRWDESEAPVADAGKLYVGRDQEDTTMK